MAIRVIAAIPYPSGRVILDALASHLVISPHLDDGVLSLGAWISAWLRQGDQVAVATVFTGGPDRELSPAARADLARLDVDDLIGVRRAEDRMAAAVLGHDVLHLDLPELLYRFRPDGTPRCECLEDIYGPLQAGAGDEELVEIIRSAVFAAIESVHPTHVHVPMAIGDHIDHVLVRNALADLEHAVAFEDMPYALDSLPPLHAPSPSHVFSESVDERDIDNWLRAIACYVTQVQIMFDDRDWQSEFRKWIAARS